MKLITRTDIFYNGYPTLQTLSRAHITRNICAMSSIASKEMFEAVGQANRNARINPERLVKSPVASPRSLA